LRVCGILRSYLRVDPLSLVGDGIERLQQLLNFTIAPDSVAATVSRRSVGKGYSDFDEDFGRFDYRKDGAALFEIHPVHRTSCNDRCHGSSCGLNDNF
jgi:hypothetical protein